MKEEVLVGTSSIPYKENCTIQVLNIKVILDTKHKKEEKYYSDFYNVTEDEVYFIDRIELDTLCDTLGYQVINNHLIIYNYDVVEGKKYHAVKRIFKYYDINENISINASANEIIDELGFDLLEKEKYKIDLVENKQRKMDEYIEYLNSITELEGPIPLVNNGIQHQYASKNPYKVKMLNPISRNDFASYFTKLITKSEKYIKNINNSSIKICDYQSDDEKKK